MYLLILFLLNHLHEIPSPISKFILLDSHYPLHLQFSGICTHAVEDFCQVSTYVHTVESIIVCTNTVISFHTICEKAFPAFHHSH